ncbi:unnamed protein product [Caenorhabditis bovis]|uniref:Uncharacterized protein n=1 Tax=Caenorhabditis bovis TaxID=2654633 RepID=A0A8S1EL65_9PELO|nr:unnamed protein product [Caenorhabditis bovis]
MSTSGCEQAQQTVKKLEDAIQLLLSKGRQVNKMLDDEKTRMKESRKQEIAGLKEELKNSKTIRGVKPITSKRAISNKIRIEEKMDFDVPSLPFEKSTTNVGSCSSSTKIEKKPSSSATISPSCLVRSPMPMKSSTSNNYIVLESEYSVQNGVNIKYLPASTKVWQNSDGSINVIYSFLDENKNVLLNVKCRLNGSLVSNVSIESPQKVN